MDLDDLRCFVAAAEAPSFRAAAGKVALSPTAFSDRIARLEDQVATPLFVRTTRRVALTPAGARLLDHARGVLDAAARCGEVARGDGTRQPYAITLGTRFELGLSWLVPALDVLAVAHPERTLHLYMADTPDLMLRVERGDIDAAVHSARITSPRIRYATIHPETYTYVGAPGGRRDTLLDVSADLPLYRYLLDAAVSTVPPTFTRYEHLGGIGAVRHRALCGAGVAVLPTYFVADDLVAGRLLDLGEGQTLREDAFRLVWRRGHPWEDRLIALAEALRGLPLR